MDPVGVNAASYWPLPNLPGTPVPGTSIFVPLNNLAATAVSANPLEQITFKVDHNFNTNRRGFIRYTKLYNVAGSPNFYNNLADTGYGPMTVHSHNVAFGYTQTFGSATVLDLRAGVNRFTAFRPSNGLGFKLTTLGLPANLEKYMQEGDVDEFPGITAQGYSNLGNNNGPYYSSNQTNYNFSGSILRVIGKHSLSFGAEHRDYFLAFFQTNPLLMNFANDMTQGPDPLAVSAAAGDGVASMLLGTGTSGSAGYYARPANANHYFGQFIQDDIKWTRKLTMNIGFRFEGGDCRERALQPDGRDRSERAEPDLEPGHESVYRTEGLGSVRRIRVRGRMDPGSSWPEGDSRHRNQTEPAHRLCLLAEREDSDSGQLRPAVWRALRRRDPRIHQFRIPDRYAMGEYNRSASTPTRCSAIRSRPVMCIRRAVRRVCCRQSA